MGGRGAPLHVNFSGPFPFTPGFRAKPSSPPASSSRAQLQSRAAGALRGAEVAGLRGAAGGGERGAGLGPDARLAGGRGEARASETDGYGLWKGRLAENLDSFLPSSAGEARTKRRGEFCKNGALFFFVKEKPVFFY